MIKWKKTEEANEKSAEVVKEDAHEVGETAPKSNDNKLSKETKDIKNWKDRIIRTRQDETELVGLTKLFTKRKVSDIRKFNMDKIEETLRNERSLKQAEEGRALEDIKCLFLKIKSKWQSHNKYGGSG